MALFNGQTISPGTLHIAEMARKAAEASKKRQTTEELPSARSRLRIGIEIALTVALLGFIGFTIYNNPPNSAQDPNSPVGTLRFDRSDLLNVFRISLPAISQPEDGTHLEGWLVSDDGATIRPVGPVRFTATGTGLLEFTGPSNLKILNIFSEVMITVEQGNADENPRPTVPSENIIYSSIFPPQALVPIRELLVSDPDNPDQLALIQGVYYYSGQYVDLMINGDPAVDPEIIPLLQALENGDEVIFRKRTEEIINLIVGDASDLYKDYDNDGIFDHYISDGYGSLPAGERLGYLQEAALSAIFAVEATDSTANIREHGENVQACMKNMEDWNNQILTLALQLVDLPMGSDAESIVQTMSDVGKRLVPGVDANESGVTDPVLGECGADLAYEQAYSMADMPIYPGKDRIPPTPTGQ